MHFSVAAALAASISTVAATRGFNSGSLALDGSAKQESNFLAEFNNQRALQGTDGAFTAARLYTMIQGGTIDSPISAIPAAKASNTKLLLGMWASGGASGFANELAALKAAIQQYPYLGGLVTGISVGSEDLYRITTIGLENDPTGVGAGPSTIVDYINQVRKTIAGTGLSSVPVGHVDTWTSWVNGSNSAVAQNCDFVGMNGFPYFQTQNVNPISNAKHLLYKAVSDTQNAVGGKPVWVTETGWPTEGPVSGQAVASPANARTYWKNVYCTMPTGTPLFWYDQSKDNVGDAANFGVVGATLTPNALYDLSCEGITPAASIAAANAAADPAVSSSSTHSTATSSHAKTSAVVTSTGSTRIEHASMTKSAADSEETSSAASKTVVSAKANGDSAVQTAAVVASGMTSVLATTGSIPSATSSLMPASANGAVGVRSTLALLAAPALLALLL